MIQCAARRIVQSLRSTLNPSQILVTQSGCVYTLTLNRPARRNAFTLRMYLQLSEHIRSANRLDKVRFIVITGAGGNFSSGNDLTNFSDPQVLALGAREQLVEASTQLLSQLCSSIIRSDKPIFALVEGKAIGFAFTQLALYDKVFVVDGTQFSAPLVRIAQGPEMCASYTFPRLFGTVVADDLLIKGIIVDTMFLAKHGFGVSFADRETAQRALRRHLGQLEELDWSSYLQARKLRLDAIRSQLQSASAREMANLRQRWLNPELPVYLMEYMAKVKARPKL